MEESNIIFASGVPSHPPPTSCVYRLISDTRETLYVGQTIDPNQRYKSHKNGTSGTGSSNIPKNQEWNMEILEWSLKTDVAKKEAHWIHMLNPIYNTIRYKHTATDLNTELNKKLEKEKEEREEKIKQYYAVQDKRYEEFIVELNKLPPEARTLLINKDNLKYWYLYREAKSKELKENGIKSRDERKQITCAQYKMHKELFDLFRTRNTS